MWKRLNTSAMIFPKNFLRNGFTTGTDAKYLRNTAVRCASIFPFSSKLL